MHCTRHRSPESKVVGVTVQTQRMDVWLHDCTYAVCCDPFPACATHFLASMWKRLTRRWDA